MGRLTRQELRWLLAQEARGAAGALREGVSRLTQPPPPAPSAAAPSRDDRLELNLNALDDAIGLLSELESGTGRPRHGRIDLAALLYEVSPNARIAIEPGAGTEVFGEETELRRLLQMLSSQGGTVGPHSRGAAVVHVRREGEWVRVSVDLGPEVSASVELERRWIARMATRLGGRLELEGGTISIVLPADASGSHTEVADLKRELEQAQQLGETYARELAAVFANADAPLHVEEPERDEVSARRFELLVAFAGGMKTLLRAFAEGLQQDAEMARSGAGQAGPLSEQLARRATNATELLGELSRIAECPLDETPSSTNLDEVVRTVVQLAERRSARHGVVLATEIKEAGATTVCPSATRLLVRALLDHAIAATPRAGRVTVLVDGDPEAVVLRFADGGPTIPAEAATPLLEGRLDASSLGRPSGIALLTARVTAAHLGAQLSIGQSRSRATEVVVRVKKR